jgi:hypothetical protein
MTRRSRSSIATLARRHRGVDLLTRLDYSLESRCLCLQRIPAFAEMDESV